MKLIKKLIKIYDVDSDKLFGAYSIICYPEMVACQIAFWAFAFFFDPFTPSSVFELVATAIFYGFGGILVYIVISIPILLIGSILKEKPLGLTFIIIGIIGTILTIIKYKP